jgi:hypothetical protein
MIFAGRVLPCCKNHETFSFLLPSPLA